MEKKIVSREVYNRILTWFLIFHQIHESLVAEEHFWNRLADDSKPKDYYEYYIDDNKTIFELNIAAVNALQVQSIVLYYQIFAR